MEPNKLKEGVSVKEIEAFAKKHRFEVFFCLAFIFACFFSFVFFGPGWSIFLAGIGGILGVIMPARIELLTKKISHFIFKQEKTTQIVLGVVGLVISIILPPIIFLLLGLHGGKSMHHQVMTIHSGHQ
jgi:hypothetical protein